MQFKTIAFEELKTSKMQYYHPLQIKVYIKILYLWKQMLNWIR